MFVWNEGNNITTLTYVSDFAKGVVGLFSNNAAINEDFQRVIINIHGMISGVFFLLN